MKILRVIICIISFCSIFLLSGCGSYLEIFETKMKKNNGVYNISPYNNYDFILQINDEVLDDSKILVSSDFFNVEFEKTYYNDLAEFTKVFYVISSEQLGDGTITFSYNEKSLSLKMHCGFYNWENSKKDYVEKYKEETAICYDFLNNLEFKEKNSSGDSTDYFEWENYEQIISEIIPFDCYVPKADIINKYQEQFFNRMHYSSVEDTRIAISYTLGDIDCINNSLLCFDYSVSSTEYKKLLFSFLEENKEDFYCTTIESIDSDIFIRCSMSNKKITIYTFFKIEDKYYDMSFYLRYKI